MFDFRHVPASPVAIKAISDVMVEEAIKQVAKDIGVPAENVRSLMIDDEAVFKRVRSYITSGYNVALAKIGKF